MECGKKTEAPRDLFCGNFGACRGSWKVCRRSWHGRCYRACQKTPFYIAAPENDEGKQWKKKKDEGRFLQARNGDMLGSSFQCDYCWFINLENRPPIPKGYSDGRLLVYIRRVNLDMLWNREAGTVSSLLSNIRKGMRMSTHLSLTPLAPPLGPWPLGDRVGFQIAIEVIRSSQEEGRNDKTHQQFDTIRKIRSAYSSIYESSPTAAGMGLTFKGPKGSLVHVTNSPLNSLFFRQFMSGLLKRMGRLVCQDLGLDVRILKEIMNNMDVEMKAPDVPWERKRHLAMCCGAFAALYAGALRGGEVFMMEGSELCKRIKQGKNDSRGSHVFVPFMGRFKHESGERNLLFVFASVTQNSQLAIRSALERVAFILKQEGKDKYTGPAICDSNGYVYPSWKVNNEFHRQLQGVRSDRPDLIGDDIDIEGRYNLFRSFRRGATSRAREMKVVPDTIIQSNNRWRKSQSVAGGLPNLPMIDLYTEIQQALLTRMRFSRSL